MGKPIKYILLLVVFAAILAGGMFAYNKLSKVYTPEQESAQTTQGDSSTEEPEAALEPAPDFSVLSTNGNTVKLSDKFGKPLVLNFWASWCGPCTGELPAFEKLYNEYGGEVEFMMVNMTDGAQETQNSAMRFLVNSDYTFPVYLDTGMEAATAYGIYFIPQTYLINEKGEIAHVHMEAVSEEKLRESIETYLLGE